MSGKRQLNRWAAALGQILFPPRCYCCGVATGIISDGICSECHADVPYIHSPLCSVCGRNFGASQPGDHICGRCLLRSPPFSLARGITYYEEPVRSLLHSLKYSFDTAAVEPLLKIARSFDFSPFKCCEIFVPVPLYSRRLKKRGLNQALVLARLFFPERADCILPQVLLRIRPTRSQTELDAAGRKHNLKSAFSVKDPDIIKNKKICLVDDIYTTGTTVRECAATLKRAGAADVMVLTFARVRELRE